MKTINNLCARFAGSARRNGSGEAERAAEPRGRNQAGMDPGRVDPLFAQHMGRHALPQIIVGRRPVRDRYVESKKK